MDILHERFSLAYDRVTEIANESGKSNIQRAFRMIAEQFVKLAKLYELVNSEDGVYKMSEESLAKLYDELYLPVKEDNYEDSYANPAFAVKKLKRKTGQLISSFIADIYASIRNVISGDFEKLVVLMELFIEICCCYRDSFEECNNKTEAAKLGYERAKAAYDSFFNDNMSLLREKEFNENFVPDTGRPLEILKKADLTDLRYLYAYGAYITDNETKIARFLNAMSEIEIDAMAETLVTGYMNGFETMNVKLKKDGIVPLYYPIGFERMMRSVKNKLEALGYTCAASDKRVYATNVNRQFEYDHRNRHALYYDAKYASNNVLDTERQYSDIKKTVSRNMGVIAVETFGEPDFEPQNKRESLKLSGKQNEIFRKNMPKLYAIREKYLPGSTTSFSIIAYPLPSIGEDFEAIFADTVRINNLSNSEYKHIQQCIIDELDKGKSVHITGRNGNETNLTVMLNVLKDPAKMTNFENCTADVNIPVGEVFTSPCLKGTNGLLHVQKVFLNGLEYKNLRVRFEDGITTQVTCENFETEEENKLFIEENLMFRHKFLPLGEFAIGTNTEAYVMGEKYGIQAKLPILIAEKTGPHFAIGDTCYSHSEDRAVFNPDGKEIIARENDYSRLRAGQPEKAYFNCHTDITVPYNELGDIVSVRADGSRFSIIKDGRFVVKGTESLNEVLDK